MTTYPGLPGPEVTLHLTREQSRESYAPGTEFAIDRVSMVGNTGTYIDSPFHRYPDGIDLAGLPLSSVADLPAVVVRTAGSGGRGVGVGALAAMDVRGAALVGIDAINIDDISGRRDRPAHSLLLAADIPVVDHLTGLDQVPPLGARFTAAPPRFASFGTFPVRAFAVVGEPDGS